MISLRETEKVDSKLNAPLEGNKKNTPISILCRSFMQNVIDTVIHSIVINAIKESYLNDPQQNVNVTDPAISMFNNNASIVNILNIENDAKENNSESSSSRGSQRSEKHSNQSSDREREEFSQYRKEEGNMMVSKASGERGGEIIASLPGEDEEQGEGGDRHSSVDEYDQDGFDDDDVGDDDVYEKDDFQDVPFIHSDMADKDTAITDEELIAFKQQSDTKDINISDEKDSIVQGRDVRYDMEEKAGTAKAVKDDHHSDRSGGKSGSKQSQSNSDDSGSDSDTNSDSNGEDDVFEENKVVTAVNPPKRKFALKSKSSIYAELQNTLEESIQTLNRRFTQVLQDMELSRRQSNVLLLSTSSPTSISPSNKTFMFENENEMEKEVIESSHGLTKQLRFTGNDGDISYNAIGKALVEIFVDIATSTVCLLAKESYAQSHLLWVDEEEEEDIDTQTALTATRSSKLKFSLEPPSSGDFSRRKRDGVVMKGNFDDRPKSQGVSNKFYHQQSISSIGDDENNMEDSVDSLPKFKSMTVNIDRIYMQTTENMKTQDWNFEASLSQSSWKSKSFVNDPVVPELFPIGGNNVRHINISWTTTFNEWKHLVVRNYQTLKLKGTCRPSSSTMKEDDGGTIAEENGGSVVATGKIPFTDILKHYNMFNKTKPPPLGTWKLPFSWNVGSSVYAGYIVLRIVNVEDITKSYIHHGEDYYNVRRSQHWITYPVTPTNTGIVRQRFKEISKMYDQQMLVHPAFYGFSVRWKASETDEPRFCNPIFSGFSLTRKPISQKLMEELMLQQQKQQKSNPYKYAPIGHCIICYDNRPGCPRCFMMPLKPNGDPSLPKDFQFDPEKEAAAIAERESKILRLKLAAEDRKINKRLLKEAGELDYDSDDSEQDGSLVSEVVVDEIFSIHTKLTTTKSIQLYRSIMLELFQVYVKVMPGGHLRQITIHGEDCLYNLHNMFKSHSPAGAHRNNMMILPTSVGLYEMEADLIAEDEFLAEKNTAKLLLKKYFLKTRGAKYFIFYYPDYIPSTVANLTRAYMKENADVSKITFDFTLRNYVNGIPKELENDIIQQKLAPVMCRQYLEQQLADKLRYIQMGKDFREQQYRDQQERLRLKQIQKMQEVKELQALEKRITNELDKIESVEERDRAKLDIIDREFRRIESKPDTPGGITKEKVLRYIERLDKLHEKRLLRMQEEEEEKVVVNGNKEAEQLAGDRGEDEDKSEGEGGGEGGGDGGGAQADDTQKEEQDIDDDGKDISSSADTEGDPGVLISTDNVPTNTLDGKSSMVEDKDSISGLRQSRSLEVLPSQTAILDNGKTSKEVVDEGVSLPSKSVEKSSSKGFIASFFSKLRR